MISESQLEEIIYNRLREVKLLAASHDIGAALPEGEDSEYAVALVVADLPPAIDSELRVIAAGVARGIISAMTT